MNAYASKRQVGHREVQASVCVSRTRQNRHKSVPLTKENGRQTDRDVPMLERHSAGMDIVRDCICCTRPARAAWAPPRLTDRRNRPCSGASSHSTFFLGQKIGGHLGRVGRLLQIGRYLTLHCSANWLVFDSECVRRKFYASFQLTRRPPVGSETQSCKMSSKQQMPRWWHRLITDIGSVSHESSECIRRV